MGPSLLGRGAPLPHGIGFEHSEATFLLAYDTPDGVANIRKHVYFLVYEKNPFRSTRRLTHIRLIYFCRSACSLPSIGRGRIQLRLGRGAYVYVELPCLRRRPYSRGNSDLWYSATDFRRLCRSRIRHLGRWFDSPLE